MELWRRKFASGASVEAMIVALKKINENALVEEIETLCSLD